VTVQDNGNALIPVQNADGGSSVHLEKGMEIGIVSPVLECKGINYDVSLEEIDCGEVEVSVDCVEDSKNQSFLQKCEVSHDSVNGDSESSDDVFVSKEKTPYVRDSHLKSGSKDSSHSGADSYCEEEFMNG